MLSFMLGVPLLLWLVLPPAAILPVVWGMALLCHHLSQRVQPLSRRDWWNYGGATRRELTFILARFVVCALALTLLMRLLKPEMMFNLVQANPAFWLLIMVLYPLLSVVPQEIIFRRYLFARFSGILPPMTLVIVSGLGFGFAHIAFNNWVAPTLCAIGGLMFARTYQRTGSLALVSFEHALYGDFLFTLGMGRYFYHGAVTPLAH